MLDIKGLTIWLTGLPCSGKTTIADILAGYYCYDEVNVMQLDGDVVRKVISRDLGFSREDRAENLRRVADLAYNLTRLDMCVICSFVSPYDEIRKEIRKKLGKFFLVYVKCPVEVCEERDVKGMYAKARCGEIKGFTGVDDPYEEPTDADVVVNTDKENVWESLDKILRKLEY